MMKHQLTILLLAITVSATTELSFDDLSDQDKIASAIESPVQIRGFLYRNGNTWILAALPNVRSCCLGTSEQAKKQVLLEGDFPSTLPQRVVTIEGMLTYEFPFYRLKQAVLIEPQRTSFPMAPLLVASLAIGLAYLLLRKLMSRQ